MVFDLVVEMWIGRVGDIVWNERLHWGLVVAPEGGLGACCLIAFGPTGCTSQMLAMSCLNWWYGIHVVCMLASIVIQSIVQIARQKRKKQSHQFGKFSKFWDVWLYISRPLYIHDKAYDIHAISLNNSHCRWSFTQNNTLLFSGLKLN